MIAISFVLLSGLTLSVAQIKPFWVDEWRLLYNLKFKTPTELWGKLDYTQQFPRVYLQVLKQFTSLLDYSYFSLRFPAFFAGAAAIVLCYRIMNKLYAEGQLNRFLFVLMIASSYTLTDYLVQIKQYEMEVFLGVAALWQLLEVLQLKDKPVHALRYILLLLGFALMPFFSYTYPIAIAPVFAVVFLQNLQTFRSDNKGNNIKKQLLLQWLPLCLCMVSIVVFYVVDVSQLMGDTEMHKYWDYRMLNTRVTVQSTLIKLYDLFAQVGAGLLFETIFGILGISAFIFTIRRVNIKGFYKKEYDINEWVRVYGIFLLLLTMVLVLTGKLPVEPKFNAFTVTSIAVMIIYLIDNMQQRAKLKKVAITVSFVLFAGLTGNIFSSFISIFFRPEYARRMVIYENTQRAIRTAQEQKIPMIVTPDVAWPDDIRMDIPFIPTIGANCVLQTWPAYSVQQGLPVHSIDSLKDVPAYLQTLPATVTSVMVGDGVSYQVVKR